MSSRGHIAGRSKARSGLGTERRIPRRDFLQGALIGAANTLCGSLLSGIAAAAADTGAAAQEQPGYYPPSLQGLRGAHPGSFEAAHALRDGATEPAPRDSGESYDLVVVGAGISGLAAAHFYQAASGGRSRILILDNHDDFGGHAKRNEFTLDGQLQLVNGGTLDIDSPRPYSAVSQALLRQLGVDLTAVSRSTQHPLYYEHHGLRRGVFFDAETFGTDKLLAGWRSVPTGKLLQDAPLSVRAREDLARIEEAEVDYLPGLSESQKKEHLARISYLQFLRDLVKVDPQALAVCQRLPIGEWGVGIDAIPALDLWGYGFPGFQGMKLSRRSTPLMSPTAAGYLETGGSVRCHFPDGNATIARLLVRRLIPGVAPGNTVEDVVSAPFDYARLDRAASAVRLRLNSTVIQARHLGEPGSATEVQVAYLRQGVASSVRARHCVLASWNMMIPYLCPELPSAQKAALHSLVKAPVVYTNVALRDWRAFASLGISEIYAPGAYFTDIFLNPIVDIGAYRTARDPGKPTVLRLERSPCHPGLTEYEQNRAGRAELLATSFATFEDEIRAQLTRMLGPAGFDAARDILGITVNRWPHGYASEFNSLFEPLLPLEQQPQIVARARFGRIAIANSDAGRAAYTDAAIDQARRAISELLPA